MIENFELRLVDGKHNKTLFEMGYGCDEAINKVIDKHEIYDKNGYKYMTTIFRLTQGTTPNICDKSNPFTMDNISKFIRENRDGITLMDGQQYIGRDGLLNLICDNHGEIKNNWRRIHDLKHSLCKSCGYEKLKILNRKTIQKTISDFNERHGIGTYDYSLVDEQYENKTSKVIIKCQKHGEFLQGVEHHSLGAGCPKCGDERTQKAMRKTIDNVIEDFNKAHLEGTYDYSFVENTYETNKSKVEIFCREHGSFWQVALSHSFGHGCPVCSFENNGWTRTLWKKQGDKNKTSTGYKVYIIECVDSKNIKFYKIGRTFLNIKKRFSGKIMPYEYKILKEYNFGKDIVSCNNAFDCEVELHRAHKMFRYQPLVSFGGDTECFSELLPMEEILQIISEIENRDN